MRERIRSALGKDPVLGRVFDLARRRGERVWLVGGTLRDLALGLPSADLDLAADHPWEMASAAAADLGGKVVSLGKESVPTYRIPLHGHHLDWVGLQGGEIRKDLKRRDFTIDAMAYDHQEDCVLDPFGGLKDLEARALRAVSRETFSDDPLRVVKAFRLEAQLPGFALTLDTRAQLEAGRAGLVDVPAERIRAEIELLLDCPAPGAALRDMHAAGVLTLLFPELRPLEGLTQNRFHHADVLEHTFQALENLDAPAEPLGALGLPSDGAMDWVTLRLAALFHDTGKALTRTVDESGEVHFYGHPRSSAELARQALRRLRFSGDRTGAVAELCLHHLRPLALLKTAPRRTALRRLIHDLGPRLPLLLALAWADKGASRGEDHARNLEELAAFIREAGEVARAEGERLLRLPKLVDGLEALDILKLSRPGPELGRALDALLEKQVEGEVSSRDQALAFLKGWAARRT